MRRSSVNLDFGDLGDDGFCLTKSNIATSSFFRRKYAESKPPATTENIEPHNFDVATFESPCSSEDLFQIVNSSDGLKSLEHEPFEEEEAHEKHSPIFNFESMNLYERKPKTFVSFDSDRESILEEDDEPEEQVLDKGESSIKLVKGKVSLFRRYFNSILF